LAQIPTDSLRDIVHPEGIEQDVSADHYVFKHVFGGWRMRFPFSLLGLPRKVAGKLREVFNAKVKI